MESALNWLRSKGIDLDDDDMDVESFSRLGVVPVGFRSGERGEVEMMPF